MNKAACRKRIEWWLAMAKTREYVLRILNEQSVLMLKRKRVPWHGTIDMPTAVTWLRKHTAMYGLSLYSRSHSASLWTYNCDESFLLCGTQLYVPYLMPTLAYQAHNNDLFVNINQAIYQAAVAELTTYKQWYTVFDQVYDTVHAQLDLLKALSHPDNTTSHCNRACNILGLR